MPHFTQLHAPQAITAQNTVQICLLHKYVNYYDRKINVNRDLRKYSLFIIL